MAGNAFPNPKYEAELRATAAAIVADGKGILAADESTGTIGKRVSGRCQPVLLRLLDVSVC